MRRWVTSNSSRSCRYDLKAWGGVFLGHAILSTVPCQPGSHPETHGADLCLSVSVSVSVVGW